MRNAYTAAFDAHVVAYNAADRDFVRAKKAAVEAAQKLLDAAQAKAIADHKAAYRAADAVYNKARASFASYEAYVEANRALILRETAHGHDIAEDGTIPDYPGRFDR